MITGTTEAGIQALIYLALRQETGAVSPRVVAAALGLSPTYLAKIMGQLVRAQVLQAHRGVKGGVTLAREPGQIRLLDVVQALQGLMIGDYCALGADHPEPVCAFHVAMREVHDAMLAALSRWTLADLAARPLSSKPLPPPQPCRMECLRACVER